MPQVLNSDLVGFARKLANNYLLFVSPHTAFGISELKLVMVWGFITLLTDKL